MNAEALRADVPAQVATRRLPLPVLIAVALAAAHAVWLVAHLAPAIMSPDANGYVVQARLIAEEGRTSFVTASPAQFVGMHWLETEPGHFYSRYPAGLPLLFAAAWKLGGLNAALLVNPLLASVTVLLVFLLARRFMPPAYALLAAAVVATVPVTNQHALDADAHIAATAFLVGGVLALFRFEASRSIGWGLGAGVLLGMVPTIRYPEAIVGVTIALWLLWRIRPLSALWPAVVGAAFPIGVLAAHNAAAFGAFWRTGYALTHEQTGFGLNYFGAHVLPYLQGLSGQGLGLIFAFGVAGLAAMSAERSRRSEGFLFAGITVPLVLLYMAYYFGGGGIGGAGGNLRFLIPTFPFLALAGAWLLARLGELLGRSGRVAVLVVAAVQLLVAIGGSVEQLGQTQTSLAGAARVRALAEKQVPAGSVLIVDRQLAESLDAVGRWKLVDESLIGGVAGPAMGGPRGPGGFGFAPGGARGFGGGGRGGGRGADLPGGGPDSAPGGGGVGPDGFGPGAVPPGGSPPAGFGGPGLAGFGPMGGPGEFAADAPSPQQRGKNKLQQERYAGLSPEERRARAWSDVAAWSAGGPVFWLTRNGDAVSSALPEGGDYRSVGEVDAPVMAMGGPAGRGGPGGPGVVGPVGPGGRAGIAGVGRPGGVGGGALAASGRGGAPGFAGAASKLRLVQLELPRS